MAPAEMFLHTLKASLPIFQAAGCCQKLLLSPLPRYWLGSCCSDVEHIPNIKDPGYEDMLFCGLDTIRRQCKDFLHNHKIRECITLNAAQLICSTSGARITPEAVRAELKKIWGQDPVHPEEQCYTALAANIKTLCADRAKLARDKLNPGTSGGQPKRARWLETGGDEGTCSAPPS